MPLAVIQRAGDDGDGAVGLEADATHLIAGVGGHLQIVTDAASSHLAARTALGLARGVAVPIGGDQRLVHHSGKFAAVVQHARRRAIRHLLRLDMVAPAQFDPVDAHLARRGLHQALHVIVALGPSRAAIRADRRRVGEHAFRRNLDQRRGVHADDVLHRVHRRRNGGGVAEPRAEIAVAGHAQCQEFAVRVQCQFRGHLMVTAMAVGQKAFRSFVGPFHRTAKRARRIQQADILRIGGRLHAE